MRTKIGSLCLLLLLLSATAQAAVYRFDAITNNDPVNAAIGGAQTWVEVADYGMDQVSFTFHNDGPEASSITDLYFDDGALLDLASIINGPGVYLEQYATPENLPNGNMIVPPFETTAGFSADTYAYSIHGVNPGEWVAIVFDLQGGQDLSDVIEDLSTGDLRIGIQVKAFDPESGSRRESFINDPSAVPIPSSLLLLGSGLIGFLTCSRFFLANRA